jgi:hypothetical protein
MSAASARHGFDRFSSASLPAGSMAAERTSQSGSETNKISLPEAEQPDGAMREDLNAILLSGRGDMQRTSGKDQCM